MDLRAEDVIAALTAQRNAAMDEIARQAAIIKALERQIGGPKNGPPTISETGQEQV